MNSNISQRESQRTRDHVSLEIISEHDVLVSSIKEKLENISVSACIFRVPKKLLEGHEKGYTPDHVSIGPLHHGKQTTLAEDDKWRYCYALLNRKANLAASLDIMVKALRELEHKARKCYDEQIDLSSDCFVQLMLIDGCFIIELFLKYVYKSLRSRTDPIFRNPGMLFEFRCNMVLLENQIPFFVLQRLFHLVPLPRQCNQTLNELASRFFKNLVGPEYEQVIIDKFSQEGYHLLDLIRHCIIPAHPKLQPKEGQDPNNLECANKLKRAGIKFKRASSQSFLDIKFVHGVFKIPPFELHQCTEILLRNLIVLEQQHIDDTVQHITSYAYLMGCLVSSKKDVKLLRRKRILNHDEKRDEEVFQVFKKLCKEIEVKGFYYLRLFEEVKKYREKSWHGRQQSLKDKYRIKTPPSIVVFVVVALVLLLTFVGAFFSILSFVLHHV